MSHLLGRRYRMLLADDASRLPVPDHTDEEIDHLV